MSLHQSPIGGTRVALLSDRWLKPEAWSRRGLTLVRLQPVAFERLLAEPPDAIVLDPACGNARQVADCWQLHDLLRVPLVVLDEGASPAATVAHLERGAADVITESPDGALLAAQVVAVLRRCRRESLQQVPAVLNLGGVEVDMVRRLVRREGGDLPLSRTEYSLLLAFLQSGGRTSTHHELMTRVWGAECASATHYLRLYIRYLREKLEDDPRRPARILNVWGVGYRLALGASEASTIDPTPPACSPTSLLSAGPGLDASATEDTSWMSACSSPPPPRPARRTSRPSAITASR